MQYVDGTATFRFLVDEDWELTDASNWEQTDKDGRNYRHATVAPATPAGRDLTTGKNIFDVVVSSLTDDALIIADAKPIDVAEVQLTTDNSGNILLTEKKATAVHGVATFHIYVKNGLGVIIDTTTTTADLVVEADTTAAPKTGYTAYVIELSNFGNGNLITITLDTGELINGIPTSPTITVDTNHTVTEQPNMALTPGSVYTYKLTVAAGTAVVANKGTIEDIPVLEGYRPVDSAAIKFVPGNGVAVAGYNLWDAVVVVDNGQIDLTGSVTAQIIERAFEVASD